MGEEIRLSCGPVYKEGAPVAQIMHRKQMRAEVYHDAYGLKMSAVRHEGIWPFRSEVLVLVDMCRGEDKGDSEQRVTMAMKSCGLPRGAKATVLEAIEGVQPHCPMKEKCPAGHCVWIPEN